MVRVHFITTKKIIYQTKPSRQSRVVTKFVIASVVLRTYTDTKADAVANDYVHQVDEMKQTEGKFCVLMYTKTGLG